MSQLNWYTVKTVSGQEKKIKTYLENEIARRKLAEFIPQILIPSEKVYEMRNGKKYQREKNFFPGYIFVHADISHGEVIPLITGIPGILGFLAGGGESAANKKPVPLRQSEINRILGKVDENAEVGTALASSFIVGETIEVIDGAFNGFTGTVEEVFEERKKIKVMVKIFGRNTPLELNYAEVKKHE